ncbi:MAG: N-6 DNA methylase [Cytophagales bacterium]|nr:N-6 DNA methylase [Cytophagales bacterium]
MLDTETKRRIDTARDILVGKVPDPKSQVEQITIALIYKFMDDMDKEAISFGGKATFFTGEYEQYGWTNIFDTKVGGHEMLTLYGEAIVKLNLNPNIPQLFRDIFKNAYLPYRDPETLKLFLKTINEFSYDHSEMLGDAFEYLLSVMGSQGDAGQFRTPRHIIDFIVEVMQPKKNETILDPACGTAGFLISSYKHILHENTKKNKGDLLTPDSRKKMIQNFVGYDISPDMVRLSLVNLYLHGFTTPSIYEYDTLTSEERWSEYYDVIIANPPFMTPKGGIKPHKKFTVQANRSEVLFVDYIAEHIHPSTGRAGIIVPEGIIFQSSNAYKALRKMLVDKNYLYAVVSLPAGIFNPYSGVKTSILLMDKTLAKKTDNILFVKIESDGFDLGAQRRAIDKNDLTACLELLQQYKQVLQDNTDFESDNKNVFLVEKEKIGADADYNLSIDRYRVNGNVQKSDFEMMKLGDLVEIKTGKKDVNQGNPNGIYPFFTCAKECTFSDEFSFDTEALLIAGNGVVGDVKYFKGKFEAYQRTYVLNNFKNISPHYLFFVLKEILPVYLNEIKQGNTMPYIKVGMLTDFKIPLPPLSIQEQFVSKLELYQKLIDGAKQVTESFKPQIEFNPSWEIVKLGDVATFKNGINYTKDSKGSKVKVLGVKDFKNNLFAPLESFDSVQIDNQLNENYELKFGDLVFVRSNGNQDLIGRCVLIPELNFKATFSGFTIRCRFNSENFLPKFYAYLFKSDTLRNKLIDSGTGANIKSLNQAALNNLEIPIPTLEEQQQIVKRIEEEQALVNSNKQLIEIFEQKIKDEINKLWQAAPKEYAMPEEKLSIAAEE